MRTFAGFSRYKNSSLQFSFIDSKMNSQISLRLLVSLIALVSGACGSKEQQTDEECPTWFNPQVRNGSVSCVCGNSPNEIVVCDQNSNLSMLLYTNCMTHVSSNSTLLGRCPFAYHEPDARNLYVKLPQNVSDLNDFMCGGLNRTGLLCGQCQPGLGPAVFSYTMRCLKCMDSGPGWLLYIFAATFPTTVLFFVIVFSQFRVTAASMNVFIFACQVLVSTVNLNPHVYTDMSKPIQHMTTVLLTLFGIWNMDFLRYVIPQFCLSSKLTTIQTVSLEYIIALYPLLLFILSYICIQLHARDCQILVYLARPLQRLCGGNKRRWHPEESLIHSFAAFLLLAYTKIFIVSCKLLHPNPVYNSSGIRVGPLTLLYDPPIAFFSTQHFPYATLAIFVIAIFIVLPLLILLLYPTRAFQHCLSCFRVRGHALRAFVDAFQGYYKDGTTGTRDWRWFSGLYLLIRIVAIGSHLLPGYYTMYLRYVSYTIMSLLFALLHPYKDNWINVWDSIAFALFAFGELTVIYAEHVSMSQPYLAYGLTTLPAVYISVYTSYKIIGVVQRCFLFQKFNPSTNISHVSEHRDDYTSAEDFPDRVVNPEQYEPLLSTERHEGNQSHSDVPLLIENTPPEYQNSVPVYGSV